MKKAFITILFLLSFTPSVSFAADIFFSADKNSFTTDEEFLVEVSLDTKDIKVNALEGAVVYPPELLELKEIRDGNSSVNFWIEKPHTGGDGGIPFSGITPGGFTGPKAFLFGLVFQSKKVGSGRIAFEKIQVLQNDGLGTKVSIKQIPFAFSISGEASGAPADLTLKDTEPPEDFNPFVANDPAIFDGEYFLVFSTVDKGAGIDHYEVGESPWFYFGVSAGKYIAAESPYFLTDQTLKSKIYVKAVDKAGNERVVKQGAQSKLAYFLQCLILAIILAICVFLYKKMRKKI